MRFRLRTLLILLALAPPLIAVAVVGLERTYFRVIGRLNRMLEPEQVQQSESKPANP